MTSLILPFDEKTAFDLLNGQIEILPFIRNFKRHIDTISISIHTPIGMILIGTVDVNYKSFVPVRRAYTIISKTQKIDSIEYWNKYRDHKKICIFSVNHPCVFLNPIPAKKLLTDTSVSSGVYYEGELPPRIEVIS